ncbi:MAG TPA: response regulator [Micromonosporaceae bacterium]|nr:response regulator [Micromonosporaceae bacterium]
MATVLVVDDRAVNRELARTLLGYGGHEVIEAHEGAEALEMAHAQHPDLVLTDILMPGMDGYELARELRAAPDTAATLIVFYTANYLEAEIRPFAEACGVSRILLKSVDPRVLMQTIDEVLLEGRVGAGPLDVTAADHEYLRAVSAKLFDKAKALSDSEARFKIMAESAPVGITFGDEHGSASYVNARLTEIMALPADDLLGLGWLHCANDSDRDEILAIARGTGRRDVQHRYHDLRRAGMPDETPRWLNVHVRSIRGDDDEHAGFIGTVDDVTAIVEADQQRRAVEREHDIEARDRATQRLQSLSTLAGGVAHDFNNILGAILAFEAFVSETITELTTAGRLEADTGRTLLKDLQQIRKGGERATGLTQQLLTIGSRNIITLAALDLNQAVRDSNDLLAPTVGTHITIVTHLAADLRPILAEPTVVAQVLMNLTLNAGHAMPDGGTLTIVTSNADITVEAHEADAPPVGRYARLTIRDTGHGMTPETLAHAIEPFFTTKARGQGSGLGLATVYGIVHQLGGILRIESSPGRGAVFTIHLPSTDQPVDPPHGTTPAPAGGTETILVVDDEDGIRDMLTRTLSTVGYHVLSAPNGAEALQLADHYPHVIHLLLSDVVMPGMLGDELAERLNGRRPDTKILLMSGYAGDLMTGSGILRPGMTPLPKPFTNHELFTAIRTTIGVTSR